MEDSDKFVVLSYEKNNLEPRILNYLYIRVLKSRRILDILDNCDFQPTTLLERLAKSKKRDYHDQFKDSHTRLKNYFQEVVCIQVDLFGTGSTQIFIDNLTAISENTQKVYSFLTSEFEKDEKSVTVISWSGDQL